jgi:hypothetical protein
LIINNLLETMKKLLAIPMAFALFLALGVNSVGAQTSPILYVELQTTGVATAVNPGAQGVTLANVRLDASMSNDDIRLQSLPLTLATANGGNAGDLSSCRVMNAANSSTSLNTGSNVTGNLAGGTNTLTFDSPLTIPRGTVVSLLVNCNASSSLTTGSTYQFSINTNNVVATAASTGQRAIVGVGRPGVVIPGTPSPTTPGIPNTGAGGQATTNILMLIGAITFVGLGLAYTKKFAR